MFLILIILIFLLFILIFFSTFSSTTVCLCLVCIYVPQWNVGSQQIIQCGFSECYTHVLVFVNFYMYTCICYSMVLHMCLCLSTFTCTHVFVTRWFYTCFCYSSFTLVLVFVNFKLRLGYSSFANVFVFLVCTITHHSIIYLIFEIAFINRVDVILKV